VPSQEKENLALDGHTPWHIDCPSCERSRTTVYKLSPEQQFQDAARQWLAFRQLNGGQRARYLSPRMMKDLGQYISALNRFFAGMALQAVHVGHIREYQTLRARGDLGPRPGEKLPVGPNKINQEVGTLVRILKEADCWTADLEKLYMPLLHEESDVPRALTIEEQDRWLRTAASRREWQFVHWYSVLGIHTTMSTNELRAVRIGDINMYSRILNVRAASAKNKYRIRTIPLSDEATWAIERMLERASVMGAASPQHYLMPFCSVRHTYDPTRHMGVSAIYKLWRQVRDAAGIGWELTPYGLRHTGCTRLAEAGTPIDIIMSMTGHVSERMRRHYTHICEQAKRRAVAAAFSGQRRPSSILVQKLG